MYCFRAFTKFNFCFCGTRLSINRVYDLNDSCFIGIQTTTRQVLSAPS